MFLLVPAHPGCPGQIPQSRKTVVCVCVLGPKKVMIIRPHKNKTSGVLKMTANGVNTISSNVNDFNNSNNLLKSLISKSVADMADILHCVICHV